MFKGSKLVFVVVFLIFSFASADRGDPGGGVGRTSSNAEYAIR
jgi:hypothetical protein